MDFRKVVTVIACLGFLGGLVVSSQIQAQCVDSMIVSNVDESDACDMGIHVPIYGRVCGYEGEDLDGFTVTLSWDPTALELDTALYEVTDPVYQSFYDIIPSPDKYGIQRCDGGSSAAVMGIFKFAGEPDVPPGRYRMCDLIFNVKCDAADGIYVIELAGDIGSPPKSPTFTYKYTDVPVEEVNQVNGTFIVGEPYGEISGTVVNSENLDPIEDAYVKANGFSDYTNQYGEYLISNLQAGTYEVIAIAFGFEPDTVKNVEVTIGHATDVDFELTPSECVNTLFCGDGSGIGGDTVEIPITAMNCSELDGYTVSLTYDNKLLVPLSIDTAGTATGSVSPDTLRCHFAPGSGVVPGCVLVQCIISSDHSRFIPVGVNKLFDIVFEVIPNPSDTGDFEFKVYPSFPWPGGEPLENEFIFEDFSFIPNLEDGQFILWPAFMRGDVNGDGRFLMGDALYILNWYYGAPGTEPPTCFDAMDYDDNGNITMGDALALLGWYAEDPGAPPPAPPWQHCGADPTPEDTFECAWHATCMSEDGALAKLRTEPYSVNESDNEVIVEIKDVSENCEVMASVKIMNNEELAGFEFSVLFDPRIFSVDAIDNAGLVSENFDFLAIDVNDVGKVRICCVPDLEMRELLQRGSNKIAEIAFKLKRPDLRGDILLQLDNVWLYNEAIEVVPAQWTDAIVKTNSSLPSEFRLLQNCPNPFNALTEISYDLPRSCHVRIEIFNLLGRKVAALVDEPKNAGNWKTVWNGYNENGEKVTSGIYFCRMEAGKFQAIARMLYLK